MIPRGRDVFIANIGDGLCTPLVFLAAVILPHLTGVGRYGGISGRRSGGKGQYALWGIAGGWDVLVVALLLVANGFLAMSELAIISARKVRLQQWAEEGDLNARTALDLANAPSHFLSTVQIGITLVGVLSGAFGGVTLSHSLARVLAGFPLLAPYSESLALGLVVVCITYFNLLAELAPKRLALYRPERIAVLMARPMRLLSRVASPVIRMLSASTDWLLRVAGVRPSSEPPVTEEEIKVLIDQACNGGGPGRGRTGHGGEGLPPRGPAGGHP